MLFVITFILVIFEKYFFILIVLHFHGCNAGKCRFCMKVPNQYQ